MKKYSFIFLIILSTLLSSCSAINEFLAESEERDAKKMSYYAPVVYQRPYEETGNTALVQTFENGKQNGPFEVHYLDGKLQIKGNYKDDKKDGVWEYYREDGTLEGKVTYKNDEANGKYESYFENGKTLYSDGTYVNGKKNGIEKEYYMSRELQSATTYKNDIPEETIMYYPSGKIYMKRNYNKTHEITYYYENGQFFLSGYVKNNTAYGEWKYYDKKGKLVTKGEYNQISKTFETVFGENLKKTLKTN
ncbi:toxin-antitoxin system YwqK family antitoxin [Fusobacterium vincentii]|uniref:toxin-antitoxin system YwqK family antitoxin n=1 Tax=Fusobacterium vincentii TaxID=155615 RepID=UPI003248CD3A